MKKLVFSLIYLFVFSAIVCAEPVTDTKLGDLLDGLGVNYKKEVTKTGEKFYDVTLTTNDYTFTFRLGLSPSKKYVWMSAYLDDLPEDVDPLRLRAMLEAVNTKTGKLQFRLLKNQIRADQPIDNVELTPNRLRQELDDFVNTLQNLHMLLDLFLLIVQLVVVF